MSGANYTYCPVCGNKALYMGEDELSDGVVVLHEACRQREITRAVDSILDKLGRDHFVTVTINSWAVEHSAQCRLAGRMAECMYHYAVAVSFGRSLWPAIGRYRIVGMNEVGVPILERADD